MLPMCTVKIWVLCRVAFCDSKKIKTGLIFLHITWCISISCVALWVIHNTKCAHTAQKIRKHRRTPLDVIRPLATRPEIADQVRVISFTADLQQTRTGNSGTNSCSVQKWMAVHSPYCPALIIPVWCELDFHTKTPRICESHQCVPNHRPISGAVSVPVLQVIFTDLHCNLSFCKKKCHNCNNLGYPMYFRINWIPVHFRVCSAESLETRSQRICKYKSKCRAQNVAQNTRHEPAVRNWTKQKSRLPSKRFLCCQENFHAERWPISRQTSCALKFHLGNRK